MDLKTAIKKSKDKLGLDNTSLSKACGVDRRIIAKMIRGENVQSCNIDKVCNYLKIEQSYNLPVKIDAEQAFKNLGKEFNPEKLTKSK
jgi:predicted transcriptional regulator